MEEVLEEKVNDNDSRLEYILARFSVKEIGKLYFDEFFKVITC